MVSRFLVLATISCASSGLAELRSQSATNSFLPFRETALLFLPARFVSEGEVKEMVWSNDGNYLLINRTYQPAASELLQAQLHATVPQTSTPKLEGEILVWNLATSKTWSIKKYDASTTQASAQWLGNSSQITFCLFQEKEAVAKLFTSTTDGSVRELPPFTRCFQISIHPLKHSAEAVLALLNNGGRGSVRRFNASLELGPEINQPRELFAGFHIETDEAIFLLYPNAKFGEPHPESSFRGENVLNGASRTLSPGQVNPPKQAPDSDKFPTLTSIKTPVNETGGTTTALLMQFEKKFVLISADCTMALANDQLTAVAFQSEGKLFIRPIERAPLVRSDHGKEVAERTMLLGRAKELAQCFASYAQDHHDTMLGVGSNWKAEMQPYVPNAVLLEEFVLAFAGGVVSAVEKPSETVLGYLQGRTGKVAAYLDGSVRWIPNGK